MGKWIPVSRELPTEDTRVLVCNKDGIVTIARRKISARSYCEWYILEIYGDRFGDPVAWMPMPEGYTGEEPEETEQPEGCVERLLQEWLKDESEKNTAWLDAYNFSDCQIEYSVRLGREEVLGKVMSLLGIE